MIRLPPSSTLFTYTTLFRSRRERVGWSKGNKETRLCESKPSSLLKINRCIWPAQSCWDGWAHQQVWSIPVSPITKAGLTSIRIHNTGPCRVTPLSLSFHGYNSCSLFVIVQYFRMYLVHVHVHVRLLQCLFVSLFLPPFCMYCIQIGRASCRERV